MTETRRGFLSHSFHWTAWYALFQLGMSHGAWAGDMARTTRKWGQQLASLATAVRAGRIAPEEWQRAIEYLHNTVPLEALIKALDVDQVLRNIRYPPEKLGAVVDVQIPELGATDARQFGQKIFVYRRGSCTPPHAHNHLVSAHLVLRGEIRARTFNRVSDLADSILIEPTVDRVFGPGHTVSMSDTKDNVHWFEGVSDVSLSFDVPVGGINPNRTYGHPAEAMNQIFLDPRVPARADGRIVAPVILFEESVRRFG